jgi:hypothetical protein
VGADVEGPRGPGRLLDGGERRLGRFGVQLGRPDRAADPEARDRGVAPRLLGRRRQRASGAGSREVRGDLGVGGRRAAENVAAEVGARWVRQLVERDDEPDDRDDVSRFQPRLAIGPPSRRAGGSPEPERPRDGPGRGQTEGAAKPEPSGAARVVEVRAAGRLPDGQQGGNLCLAARLADVVGAARPAVQPDRLVPAVGGRLEVDRHLEPGAAREDAHGAGIVAHAEPDRALLRERLLGRVVALLLDRRAVEDRADRLERRDEGHLGRLDHAADAHLADGEGRDARRRRVGDPGGVAVATEAADEQAETGQEAGGREGRELDRDRHARIVGAPVSAVCRIPATRADPPWIASALRTGGQCPPTVLATEGET